MHPDDLRLTAEDVERDRQPHHEREAQRGDWSEARRDACGGRKDEPQRSRQLREPDEATMTNASPFARSSTSWATNGAFSSLASWAVALTLRGLERDGLVTRTVTPTIPPRVDYELTKLGLTLLDPVQALAEWAERHRPAIQAARDRFDQQAVRRLQETRGQQPSVRGRPRGA